MPRKRKSASSSSSGAAGATADGPKPDLPVIQDSRFASIHNDPRFIPISKKQVKVKVDKRFKDQIASNAQEFLAGPPVDKFGRPRATTNKEDLERYYDFDSDSEASGSEDEKESAAASSDESDAQPDEEDDEHAVARRRHAGLRGGLSDASESDSDSDSDDFDAAADDLGSESEPDSLDLGLSDGEPDDEEGVFDEVLDRKHIPMGDATCRFAAVNMDWDHIKAADLFKVFDSLKPPGAVIHKVSVYPSEFGRERMAHEAQFGPALGGGKSVAMDAPAEVGSDFDSDDEGAREEEDEPSEGENDDEEDEEDAAGHSSSSRMKRNLRTLEMEEDDTDFDSVALRKYQLERLRYYYAVVECDTVDTAYAIFKAADGAEFEATSNFFDLRFIPDDVSFAEDEPARDVATPESAVAYRPIKFETKALQSSNVKLTWDEDDPDRAQITRKTLSYDELKALDFKDYVASDSDDDADASGGEGGDDEIAKYRALLGLDGSGSSGASKGKKKQKRGKAADSDGASDDDSVHGDMEITFTAGLSETAERLIQEREERKKLENETTIEKYERKQRERRQRRKDARMQQEQGSDDDMIGGNVVGDAAADAEELGFDDPFFAMDVDFDDAEEADRLGTKLKTKKDAKKPKAAPAPAADGESGEQSLTKKQKKQSKRKQREEEARREDEEDGVADFSVDASDSRFAPVLAEPEFAIDPTNPHFRDTPGMKTLLKAKRRNAAVKNKEKQQERQSAAGSSAAAAAASNGGAKNNLLALADAVKRKTSAAMDAEAGQGRRNKKAKKA